MYLSRVKLDVTRTRTMQALVNPGILHGAIERAEGLSSRTRKLWRLDDLRGKKYLLVLSEKAIDFSDVAAQFGYDDAYEAKCYDGLLARVTNGSQWQFRLKANPTIQKYDCQKGRGKVLAHITSAHQETWLKTRAAQNGFCLSDGEFLAMNSRWYKFQKNRTVHSSVRLLAVTYEGVLTVTDAAAFRNALIHGIGREKAYGMGLLTITGIRHA